VTKASDNEFPSVLFDEQAGDPSTPASGFWRAYFKSGGLYVIDDAGSVVGPLAPAAGASNLQAAKYQRTSANYTTTSTSFADVDGTNMSLAITTGARRVMVGFTGTVAGSGLGDTIMLDVDLDGARLGGLFGLVQARTPVATYRMNGSFTFLTNALTAASHTFKLQWRTTANTATMYGTSASDGVATFWVQEIYGA
jgi:hypothetical protein